MTWMFKDVTMSYRIKNVNIFLYIHIFKESLVEKLPIYEQDRRVK